MSAPVIVVSPDELREIVRSAVREALDDRRGDDAADWLDTAGAAALLRVHRRTVARLAQHGEIPSSRVGRLLRLRRTDVLAYLTANRTG